MVRDPRNHLWDAVAALDSISNFVRGRVLIHGYAQVDDRLVWQTVGELPALRVVLATLLHELDEHEP